MIGELYPGEFEAMEHNGRMDALEQEPCDVFDEYGNYKYPSDVELTEPNAATSMPCEDAISRQAAIDEIRFGQSYVTKISPTGAIEHLFDKENKALEEAVERIEELPPVYAEPKTGWIPMTKRPMTEEEREHYREWSDIEGAMIFDCELPEDGQEVLVSHGGYVCVDTFCKDDGCYFEGVDIDDVDAWMPLPASY